MKYTKQRINRLIEAHDRLVEHVNNVARAAGFDEVESVNYIWGDKLKVTTATYYCGSYETKEVELPLDWVTAEDPAVLRQKIFDTREEERRQAEIRRQEELRKAAEQQEARERAEFARLQAKYQTNN